MLQGSDKLNDCSPDQDQNQDLRSRGLCLVPISSTYPVANELTATDYWTPTFGGAFGRDKENEAKDFPYTN